MKLRILSNLPAELEMSRPLEGLNARTPLELQHE